MSRAVWWLAVVLLLAGGGAMAAGSGDAARLGLALYEAGRFADAVPHLEEAVRQAGLQWGAEDPRVAAELNNLGEAYRRAGRAEAAEAAFRRAVAIDQRADPEGVGLATGLNNLGLVLAARGRAEEAQTLYLRSLELLERRLGPHHPDVARGLANLAALHLREGEPALALPVQERAVTAARRSLGDAHQTTRQMEESLAAIRAAALRRGEIPEGPPPLPELPGSRIPPPPSAQRKDPPPARFALHLASVRKAEDAAREWLRLQRFHPELSEMPHRPAQPVEVKGKGTWWRVLGGALAERQDAVAICRVLVERRQYCRVVEP